MDWLSEVIPFYLTWQMPNRLVGVVSNGTLAKKHLPSHNMTAAVLCKSLVKTRRFPSKEKPTRFLRRC